MNREQKRNYTTQLKKKGLSNEEIRKMIAYKELLQISPYLDEFSKVKLNLDVIRNHPDYDKLSEKYKAWTEAHKDEIFTLVYDEKHREKPSIVCLKEDTTDPKWLFFTGDLIVVNPKEGSKSNGMDL
jgi:hypothetical protein